MYRMVNHMDNNKFSNTLLNETVYNDLLIQDHF